MCHATLFEKCHSLPTFWYRWATFVILLTSFSPFDFHSSVTKTILSTNIKFVYLCSRNAIQLNQQNDKSWLKHATFTKQRSIDNCFIYFEIKANRNKKTICISLTEGNFLLVSLKHTLQKTTDSKIVKSRPPMPAFIILSAKKFGFARKRRRVDSN